MRKNQNSPFITPALRNAVRIIAVALAACILVMPAFAHPSSDVMVKYDQVTNQLEVTITHPVDDPATHYIKRVKVDINGRIVADNEYKNQPAKDVVTYTYAVPVNAGDTVRVTATCSIAGSTEGVLTLPTPTSTAPPTIPPTTVAPVPTTQKSSTGLIPLLGLGCIAALALALNRK